MGIDRAAIRSREVLSGYDKSQPAFDTSKNIEQSIARSAENLSAVENAKR
jgi:hypothetical protein